ncbi:MAG: ABC transporter permease [Ruminococcaceae bacterium]|nr:ABC transporter permease [Oscillospiraceae bacterium]
MSRSSPICRRWKTSWKRRSCRRRRNCPSRKPPFGNSIWRWDSQNRKAVRAMAKAERKQKASSTKTTRSRRRSFNVGYLTKEGIRNVWSNRLMSVASVAVLTSCLLLIGVAIMLYANIDMALDDVQEQNIIMVYLDDNISEEDINTVGQDIRMISDIESAEFVSKEEAYQSQLESLGDDAKLMEGLEENPLPDSYEVYLKTLDHYDSVQESLKSIDHVASVRGNSDLAEQVRQLSRAVTIISVGIIIMLLAVSLFIIANTVRVTMYNRRLEISIMKAVGATNWFIRWPFIIEGVIIGIVSGLVSEGLVWALYSIALKNIGSVFSMLGSQVIPFSAYAGKMLIAFIFVGILAGAVGSIVSMTRYLKEQGSVISDDN